MDTASCAGTGSGPSAIVTARPAAAPIDWARIRHWVRNAVVAVVAVIGGVLLLRQGRTLGLAVTSVAHANPVGLVLTGGLAAATYIAAAVAITAASGRSLPLGRTTAVQLAAAATNRIAPAGLGAMATNMRYLEGDGATRNEAVTAIGITSAASFVVHAVATALALALVHRPIGTALPSVPTGITWVGALLAAVIVIALGIAFAPRIVHRVGVAVRHAWSEVTSMCADPRRVVRLLAGTVGVTFGHGLAFVVAVTACGIHLPVVALLAVFLAGSAVGSAAPTPGGLGAVEAALVAGLSALGAGMGPAVAGVLTYRLITYWLPIIPGAIALKMLRPALGRAEPAPTSRVASGPVSPVPAVLR